MSNSTTTGDFPEVPYYNLEDYQALRASYDALRAERDALRTDAERYRWLMGDGYSSPVARLQAAWRMWDGYNGIKGFTAAIDAARIASRAGPSAGTVQE